MRTRHATILGQGEAQHGRGRPRCHFSQGGLMFALRCKGKSVQLTAHVVRSPDCGSRAVTFEALEGRVLFDALPSWVSASGTDATWTAATSTLTVSGAATIVADT